MSDDSDSDSDGSDSGSDGSDSDSDGSHSDDSGRKFLGYCDEAELLHHLIRRNLVMWVHTDEVQP
jgi:hypothetical protein